VAEAHIEIRGLDEANQKLERFGLFLNDLRPFWPLVVPIFISWMRSQFESEGGWGGTGWSPLSPKYAARKARLFGGKTILIAEGDLRQAASMPSRRVGPRELVLTIEDPKAGFHQEGTSRMPARPLIPKRLPMMAQREVEQAADRYVVGLIRRLDL
jgi:hypothetical protein